MRTLRLRYALLLARRPRVVVVGLVLLALVSGAIAGLSYADSGGTYSVTEQTDVQSFELSVTDSAVVTNETRLWATGTRLTDHPAYLTDASPNLTLTTSLDVPSGTAVEVRSRTVLVVEAIVDGERFWIRNRTLATARQRVTDGRFTTDVTLSIPALLDRLATVRKATDDTAEVVARVRSVVRYDSGTYRGRLASQAAVQPDPTVYEVGTFDPASRTHSTPVTRRRQRENSGPPMRSLIGGAVAVLALVGAVFSGYRARDLDNPAGIRRDLERSRFSEWISEGKVPAQDVEATVWMTNLTDLVDVAIDTDKRVVHDPSRDVYVVLDGDVAYVYTDRGAGTV